MLQYITNLFLKRCGACCALYIKSPDYFQCNLTQPDGLDYLCIPCRQEPEDNLRLERERSGRNSRIRKAQINPRSKPNTPRQEYSGKKAARRAANLRQWARPELRAWLRVYYHNRRARLRGLPHTFTRDEWSRCRDYFNGCCAVCGRQGKDLFKTHTIAADHWIPLANPDCPGTVATNMLPLCHGEDGCNNTKWAKHPNDWLFQVYGKQKAATILKRVNTYFDWVRCSVVDK